MWRRLVQQLMIFISGFTLLPLSKAQNQQLWELLSFWVSHDCDDGSTVSPFLPPTVFCSPFFRFDSWLTSSQFFIALFWNNQRLSLLPQGHGAQRPQTAEEPRRPSGPTRNLKRAEWACSIVYLYIMLLFKLYMNHQLEVSLRSYIHCCLNLSRRCLTVHNDSAALSCFTNNLTKQNTDLTLRTCLRDHDDYI